MSQDQLPQTAEAPIPEPDGATAPYWAALAEGRLLLQRCDECGALNHPASAACRACASAGFSWEEVPPRGRLYSWAIEVRPIIPGLDPPYVIAQLTPEGCADGEVRLVGNLITDGPDSLSLDLPLTIRPATPPASDRALLYFVPV